MAEAEEQCRRLFRLGLGLALEPRLEEAGVGVGGEEERGRLRCCEERFPEEPG